MADEAELQVSPEETTVENTAESQPEEQSTDTGVQQTESAEDTADVPKNQDTATKEPEAPKEAKDDSPTSRRSAKYRIQQLVEENKALKAQAKPEPNEWEAPQEDEQPDISALIAKEVERRLNPVISENSKSAADGEISELFSGEKSADRSSYEPKIREMWNQAQYKDVAAADLYKIAKFDEAVGSIDSIKQQAIEEYKQAQKEAKESSSTATSNISNRMGKNGKQISEMSDAELLEHNERVKAGLA